MRKIVSILCILCASVTLMAQTKSKEPVKGAHPYQDQVENKIVWDHAYWSILPYVGIGFFQGDFIATELENGFSTMTLPNLGLGVECSFNPAWSLGLEYGFAAYKIRGNQTPKDPAIKNADTLLLGHNHMVDLYVAADLINLIHPYGRKKPVSLSLIAGLGGAMYKNPYYFNMNEENTAGRQARGNTQSLKPDTMTNYDFCPFFKFGANLEFNINRTLALGIRAAYNLYTSDLIDGRKFNPNTDGIFDISLNMRFKLEAVSKTHARNVAGRDFPDYRPILPKEARSYIKQEVSQLTPTQTIINEIHQDGPAAEVVAVPAGRDTVVIYHRDTIVIREEAAATPVVANPEANAAAAAAMNRTFYVYFGSEKTKLDHDGLITVQQVADRLTSDESLYAVIVAYCDNTGSRAYNYELADKRSASVADELREEYGIDAARMCASGKGVVVGRRSQAAYGPNRRVEIKLVDRETFNKTCSELENERANRVYGQETTVKVKENETLAQLARKHYGNTHCWVYIYAANKDKIAKPSALTPGTELIIPQISGKEQAITKDECLRLYNQTRAAK